MEALHAAGLKAELRRSELLHVTQLIERWSAKKRHRTVLEAVVAAATARVSALAAAVPDSKKAAPSRPAELCSDSELLSSNGCKARLPSCQKKRMRRLWTQVRHSSKTCNKAGAVLGYLYMSKAGMGRNWHDAADALARRAMQGAREPALRHRKMRLRTAQGRRA